MLIESSSLWNPKLIIKQAPPNPSGTKPLHASSASSFAERGVNFIIAQNQNKAGMCPLNQIIFTNKEQE
jgi:hypothetical protein